MYDKEIKDLEWLKCETSDEIGKTIDTAIALMRAAEPKDEEAEREHCEKSVETWMCCEVEPCVEKSMQNMLLRERAAVRAECAAEIERWKNAAADYAYEAEEAKAEIERLKSDIKQLEHDLEEERDHL